MENMNDCYDCYYKVKVIKKVVLLSCHILYALPLLLITGIGTFSFSMIWGATLGEFCFTYIIAHILHAFICWAFNYKFFPTFNVNVYRDNDGCRVIEVNVNWSN